LTLKGDCYLYNRKLSGDEKVRIDSESRRIYYSDNSCKIRDNAKRCLEKYVFCFFLVLLKQEKLL